LFKFFLQVDVETVKKANGCLVIYEGVSSPLKLRRTDVSTGSELATINLWDRLHNNVSAQHCIVSTTDQIL